MHYFTTDCTHGITMSQWSLRLNNKSGQGKRRFNYAGFGKCWVAMMQIRYKLNFLNYVYWRNSHFDTSYPHKDHLQLLLWPCTWFFWKSRPSASHFWEIHCIFEIPRNLTKNEGIEELMLTLVPEFKVSPSLFGTAPLVRTNSDLGLFF